MASPGYISGELNITVGAVYADPPGDDKRHAALDLSQATAFRLTVTDDDDFDLDLIGSAPDGSTLTLTIVNDSGDDMGAVTWDADLVPYGVAFTLPEDGGETVYAFAYDGTVWRQTGSTSNEAGVLKSVVLMSNADVLALHTDPFVVVPSPGPGAFINPISLAVIYALTDDPYDASSGVDVLYDGGSALLYQFGSIIEDDGTGASFTTLVRVTAQTFTLDEMVDKAVVAVADTTAITGDGGPVMLIFVYTVEAAPSTL